MQTPKPFDVIVLGAGAAGLMAAATAGKQGRRVLVLDHAEKVAEKIRVSGGGRCNFTNLHVRPECYISNNPHYVRSALAQFNQHDFIEMVNQQGIAWHEKTLGQLFCDDSSQQIIDLLDNACQQAGVTRQMGVNITAINRLEETGHFQVQTSAGTFPAESLIVATGGLALPQVGATPLGYQIAEQFGIAVIPPMPALVPLALHEEDKALLAPLSGVSMDVIIGVQKKELTKSKRKQLPLPTFKEKMLFTHRGLSGPAVLQISSYWEAGDFLEINLLPNDNAHALLASAKQSASNPKLLSFIQGLGWPNRFAERWLSTSDIKALFPQKGVEQIAELRVKELSNQVLEQLATQIHHWQLQPNGTLGYKQAEASRGGVDTHALDSKTMQAKAVPNLFFVGEVVDVTGWLGGYNFQWAWSSGYVAGMSA